MIVAKVVSPKTIRGISHFVALITAIVLLLYKPGMLNNPFYKASKSFCDQFSKRFMTCIPTRNEGYLHFYSSSWTSLAEMPAYGRQSLLQTSKVIRETEAIIFFVFC